MSGRRIGVTAAALILLLGAQACRFSDLNFLHDTRVEIVAPQDRETVRLPFELRWNVRDFEVGDRTLGGGGSYFAVFADRNPMAPGAHIDQVADDPCQRTPGCPDEAWLRDRNIFLTTGTSLVIETLPDLQARARAGVKEMHEITIVLVGDDDRRVGESAFAREFFVERDR